MKKVLFLDRDGTLIRESPGDFQVDTLEKLEFMPGVFRCLHFIRTRLDFELVIVSNQDGLGTAAYPEAQFSIVQQKMLKAFENEGIVFDNILIDKSRPEDEAPTRKPRLGLLSDYLNTDEYDLKHSLVIGDRITDVELAKNLGAKAILLGPDHMKTEVEDAGFTDSCLLVTDSWDKALEAISLNTRRVAHQRVTNESSVNVKIDLDGEGVTEIHTGLGFFDHMLSQIGKHAGIDLEVKVDGDLHVDEHHTIEDTAITLGEAFRKAMGDKRGMERYGFVLPMDDCMAQAVIDFGGRPWLIWNASFVREKVGEMPTEMFMHFFKSFSDSSGCNLQISASGENEHHKIEAIFKAVAKAIKMAIRRNPFEYQLPTTKGVL